MFKFFDFPKLSTGNFCFKWLPWLCYSDSTAGYTWRVWENWAWLAWEVDQEISDDLRHALAIFSLWRAPKGPQASPMVPNGQPCVPWEVQIRNFTMEWFYYGKTERCLNERWINEYVTIRATFWPFSGSEGPSKGLQRSSMENQVCLRCVKIEYFTKG